MPPCGGHPKRACSSEGGRSVSSRAPVWGASPAFPPSPLPVKFQVVPPCGGHRRIREVPPDERSFKSCPRVGGIADFGHVRSHLRGFKSCPRVGGILPQPFFTSVMVKFQVVPPCGGHLPLSANFLDVGGFKSCPRVGGIRQGQDTMKTADVSSRAPVWGASTNTSSGQSSSRFQVVPPCGGHPPRR